MNKKYLILRRPVKKAQWGLGTDSNWVSKKKKDQLAFDMFGDSFLGSTEGSDAQKGMLDVASSDKGAGISAGIGAGLGVAQMGSDALFANAFKKNSVTGGYGGEVFDDKDVKLSTGQGAASGALKGAQMGMAFGPWGALIGGAIGGGIGLFTGKKKGEEAKEAYDEGILAKNKLMSKSQDRLNSEMLMQTATGKSGIKLKKKNLGAFTIQKKKSKSLILRKGGKLETPGEVNVVVKGKLHKENNNLGNKDKGVPVVDANGVKEYEVEKGEIIFRQDTTHLIEDYATKYKETGDDSLLEDLGTTLAKELLKNTQDNDGEFGVKVKEDAN